MSTWLAAAWQRQRNLVQRQQYSTADTRNHRLRVAQWSSFTPCDRHSSLSTLRPRPRPRQQCVWVSCERQPICCDLCQNNCVYPMLLRSACHWFVWDCPIWGASVGVPDIFLLRFALYKTCLQIKAWFMFRIPNPVENFYKLWSTLISLVCYSFMIDSSCN